MANPVKSYLSGLYERAMRDAYAHARAEIAGVCGPGARVLDCGAWNGEEFDTLSAMTGITKDQYAGIEWSAPHAEEAQAKGLNVVQADLNRPMPFEDESFDCVYGLSVLEHLLNGCAYMREAHRVLKPGGKLVILTPNISTWFTIGLLMLGRMPSTGPHPDSTSLFQGEVSFDIKDVTVEMESETPTHRHLVVFSYRTLGRFLGLLNFRSVEGRAFGLYPFPNFSQPVLQRLDPWHCHQMVYTATK